MAESLCELPGCHRATARMKRHQDVTPVLVGECREHRLELVELAEAPRPWLQSVSFVEKCGKAIPGPIGRSSTKVSIRSQITPTWGCCAARREPSASSH